MSIKNLEGKYKANIIKMVVYLLILLAIIVIPLFFLSNKKEDTIKVVENDKFNVDTTDELIELFYEGDLSASQMQNEVNKYLKYEPDFSQNKEDVSDEEIGKAITKTKEMTSLLTAYLDGLFVQQKKLNKVASNLRGELLTINDMSDTPVRDSVVEIEGYDSPLVNGLLLEMSTTPLFVNSEENNYQVWVDYDVLDREYNKYFTSFHKNLMSLHKNIIRFGYTREDGKIDIRNIYNRLVLLDEIQEGHRNKDNFYWEKERYQHAMLLTGYGTENKPDWDKETITQMEAITSAIDDESNLDQEPYLRIVYDLLNSVKEEGEYGEGTIRIANKWMHEQFTDYREYLENKQTDNE